MDILEIVIQVPYLRLLPFEEKSFIYELVSLFFYLPPLPLIFTVKHEFHLKYQGGVFTFVFEHRKLAKKTKGKVV